MIKTVTSISGGQTSAYIAANYPADELVFALVRTNDPECKFPDAGLRKKVSRRIGKEFNGTLEDDMIIYTIFDLEQYLGRKIHWVSGVTFEKCLEIGGGCHLYLEGIVHLFLKWNLFFIGGLSILI